MSIATTPGAWAGTPATSRRRRQHIETIGQTSPLYLYAPAAAARIAALLPDVKLIFILRNPLDRAYSHYWHEIKKGRETLDFEAALAMEEKRIALGDDARRSFSYVDRGRYAAPVSATSNHEDATFCRPPHGFNRNPARIPRSVRVQRILAPWRSRLGILANVVDWLNLKPAPYPPMAEHLRRRFALEFHDDIDRLEKLTDMSFERSRLE